MNDQRRILLTKQCPLLSFLYLLHRSLALITMRTFIAAALLSVDLVDAQGFKIGQIVKTTSGDITGQPSSWKPGVSEFLGIPFAEPPVGKLRWAAPVAFKAPGKAVNATKYVRCF
jgi:hypothetical protein